MSEAVLYQATLCKHKIEIEINGQYKMFKNLTDFKPEFGGQVETWNPMELMGASKSEKTSVENKINASAYRTYGAEVNDAIADCIQGMLDDVKFKTRWTTPNQKVYEFIGVYNVTSITSGTTKDLDKMDFEIYPCGLLTGEVAESTYTE